MIRSVLKFLHRFAFRLLPMAIMLMALATGTMMLSALREQYGSLLGAPLWPLAVGLVLAAAAGAGILTQFALGRTAHRAEALAERNMELIAERDSFHDRSRLFARQVESLSLLREIHRTSNITSRPERIRRLLGVVADISEASDLTLYGIPEEADGPGGVRAAAHLSRSPKYELFMIFSPRLDPCATEFLARDVTGHTTETSIECHGYLEARGAKAGEAALSIQLTPETGPLSGREPGVLLGEVLELCPLDHAGLAEVLERGTLVRHRGRGSHVELLYPLAAEGGLVGALKLRIEKKMLARGSLSNIEDLLAEGARHIALEMKREETVDRARYDSLTGLMLKRELYNALREQISLAADGQTFSLIMLDIDHFKHVNDTCGHLSGDMVLKAGAQVIADKLRAQDMAYRYGGEEIAIVLPGAPLKAALGTAERLRVAIEDTEFTSDRGQAIPVTISLGVSEFELAVTAPDLLQRADEALYHAKKKGRNRVSSWPSRLMRRSRRVQKVAGRPRGSRMKRRA